MPRLLHFVEPPNEMGSDLVVQHSFEALDTVLKRYLHVYPDYGRAIPVRHTGCSDVVCAEVNFCHRFYRWPKLIEVLVDEVLHFLLVLHFATTVELVIGFAAICFKELIKYFDGLW